MFGFSDEPKSISSAGSKSGQSRGRGRGGGGSGQGACDMIDAATPTVTCLVNSSLDMSWKGTRSRSICQTSIPKLYASANSEPHLNHAADTGSAAHTWLVYDRFLTKVHKPKSNNFSLPPEVNPVLSSLRADSIAPYGSSCGGLVVAYWWLCCGWLYNWLLLNGLLCGNPGPRADNLLPKG